MVCVHTFRHLEVISLVLLLCVQISCGDFFSDIEKLDLDSKLQALDDVISAIDIDNPKPSKKRKPTKSEDSLGDTVEALSNLFGEHCKYQCENGNRPAPRPGHLATSNGCGSYGMKIEIDELPGMDRCCDDHDICYDTCNTDRATCDKQFKKCLHNACLKIKALELSDVPHKDCKMAADLMYSGTVALGCEPYLKAQEKACVCPAVVKSPSDNNKRGNRKKYKVNDEL